ncbi:MAG: O-methyltransferase [Candidatus Acidiferrales bacterium]
MNPEANRDQWTAVDAYFTDLLVGHDPALESALRASEAAGLPRIQVSPTQGKMLHLLARSVGARNILEIGTLGAYSTIWLARALPARGRLITLEADAKHAEVSRANIARAGLAEIVDLRLGKAIDSLPRLAAEGRGPFDLIFIDADKPSNPDYWAWALKLSRRGTLIVIDNVVRKGGVADAASTDADVRGTRQMFDLIAAERRVSATAIQTVGSKGYDGFSLALVLSD